MEKKVKMNNIQVMGELKGIMSTEQKELLAKAVERYKDTTNSDRQILVHGALDVCHKMNNDAVKAGLRQLCKKYLSGAQSLDGEESACRDFMNFLTK